MFASNECSVDLKAIYHLGCMFWKCLAHPWNYLRRCTLKYYDTFIEGYKNGTLWSNSRSARDKNNCIIIIKGWFCCTWTQMNLTTVFTHSYLFISLPAKYFIHWNRVFQYPQRENINTWRWRKFKSVLSPKI